MNILFTLLLFLVPATAYANTNHEFEKFLYNEMKHQIRLNVKIDFDKYTAWTEYVPTVMQIYLNSFALQQYETLNYTLVAEKLSWKEVKIGVRYYF